MANIINIGGGSGGGGDASKLELTWAQYLALSDAEKYNGTMYFCTDANGDGSDFQPVIYSEDEREIGVWLDGKPLYEKSYPITNTNISTGWNILINNVSNIDTFVAGGCNLTDSSSYDYSWKASYHYNGNIAIYNFLGGSISSANGYVSIRYTKTTDTAGSGTFTPQGIPAVHYSTNEHIVGTWIDGSTIYEKTIQKTINCNTELVIVNSTDIPNLNTIISYDGNFGIVPLNFFNNSDYRSYTHTINSVLNGFVKLGNTATTDITITIRYTKSTI